jgi:hypothetical protein
LFGDRLFTALPPKKVEKQPIKERVTPADNQDENPERKASEHQLRQALAH